MRMEIRCLFPVYILKFTAIYATLLQSCKLKLFILSIHLLAGIAKCLILCVEYCQGSIVPCRLSIIHNKKARHVTPGTYKVESDTSGKKYMTGGHNFVQTVQARVL
jgi:hypothetical protein